MLERMLRAIWDGPGNPLVCRLYTGDPRTEDPDMGRPLCNIRYCDFGHDPVEWTSHTLRCWFCGAKGMTGHAPDYARTFGVMSHEGTERVRRLRNYY
jgi:hypothetical protein